MRIQEVSKHLNISKKRVERLIAEGRLSAEKKSGIIQIDEKSLNNVQYDFLNFPQKTVGKDLFGNEVFISKNVEKKSLKFRKTPNWVAVEDSRKNPSKSNLTAADLFAGAGGISKGFEWAGIEMICGMDWFKEAGQTYRRNFSHSFIEGDISKLEIKEKFYKTVREKLNGKALNVLAGGFPCQGFSLAGNRVVTDPRNSLYLEMLEITEELQPDFVVMENVKGLRSMLKGKVEEKIIRDLENIGYKVDVAILNAADYKVPQKRERIIFIGNRIKKTNFHPQPILTSDEYLSTKSAIEDLMDLEDDKNFNHFRTKHRPDIIEKLAKIPEGGNLYENYSDAWKKCPWNEPSCTIKENHGGVNVHPRRPRVITAREMARLQSFPDDFIFEGPKNKQLVQIGNAVPPLLAKAIGLAIRKSYENS